MNIFKPDVQFAELNKQQIIDIINNQCGHQFDEDKLTVDDLSDELAQQFVNEYVFTDIDCYDSDYDLCKVIKGLIIDPNFEY